MVLIDTSVLCTWLEVPNLAADIPAVKAEMERLVGEGASLLIPLAVILETGNHIAQNGDGRVRRGKATVFARIIRSALRHEAPWTLTRFADEEVIRSWLDRFPDYAGTGDKKGKGIGIGDVSILAEWEHQCAVHRHRRVRIWSLDGQLANYDRRA